jgi:PAS domain S-box-containing protein
MWTEFDHATPLPLRGTFTAAPQPWVLVATGDASFGHLVAGAIERLGVPARSVLAGAAVLAQSRNDPPTLLVTEAILPDMDAAALVDSLRAIGPVPPFIVISPRTGERQAVDMMKLGAVDYLVREGGVLEALPVAVGRALELVADARRREAHRRSIAHAERRFREIIQTANLVCITLDRAGCMTFANTFFLDLTGWREAEVLGAPYCDLFIPPEAREEEAAALAEFMAGEDRHAQHRNRIVTRNGEFRHIAWDNTLLRSEDGEAVGMLGFGRDVTREHAAEEQLRQRRKTEILGTMTGGIAHDFNNILNCIMGYAELLQLGMEPTTRPYQYVEEIMVAGRRAAELVRRVQTLSRAERADRRAVRLQPTLHDALAECRRGIPKHVQLAEQVDAAVPPVVANPGQIHLLLANLCRHALGRVRELPSGRLHIRWTTLDDSGAASLVPSDYTTRPLAVLTVEDNGADLDEGALAHLFDPHLPPGGDESTGLDMAVALGIVKGHGGRIVAAPAQPKGLVVHAFLPTAAPPTPVAPPPPGDPEAAAMSRQTPIPIACGGYRVLLVDDDDALARLGKVGLERLGFTVSALTDSFAALDLFRATPTAFDLVLTDLNMPRMGGSQLAREVRALHPDIPIVILTGFGEMLTEAELTALRINRLVLKPIALPMLARVLEEVLSARR